MVRRHRLARRRMIRSRHETGANLAQSTYRNRYIKSEKGCDEVGQEVGVGYNSGSYGEGQ